MITKTDRRKLSLQQFLGGIAVVVTAPLCFLFVKLRGYSIRDLKQVRQQVKSLTREHEGPWLVCPNHLTMIDSLVLTYGLLSLSDHILHFRQIPWNLPEIKNFYKNTFLVVLCYLLKCIPVDRGGSREEVQRLLDKCLQVFNWKQRLVIFPEGTRSRHGRVDRENFSYGVGRLVDEQKETRVLIVYLRGDHQENYGSMPVQKERFTMLLEAFVPERREGGGLRVQRDYARQIVERLALLEEQYFASRRQ
ncbi:MAG: 1-acyl-sn-glycerol-3-phosphate acyltransferase [Syntrophobacterales bacterium]|nr:1-acyl-sn-glycerol-3-phosphate acyltransferase [Syntrophobacterales bacterium]